MSENETDDPAQSKARTRRERRRRESAEVRPLTVVPATVEVEAAVPKAGTRRASTRRVVEAVAPPRVVRIVETVSDREAVLAANALFYRAFELRDAAAMGETWAKVPYARCIHPGWEPLCGWEEIVGSWTQLFRTAGTLRFELADVMVRVGGGLAWVELSENLEAEHEGKPARSQVLATNIFERQPDGQWRMIHHHSSPVMVRHPSPKRGGEPLH